MVICTHQLHLFIVYNLFLFKKTEFVSSFKRGTENIYTLIIKSMV